MDWEHWRRKKFSDLSNKNNKKGKKRESIRYYTFKYYKTKWRFINLKKKKTQKKNLKIHVNGIEACLVLTHIFAQV